MDPASIGLLITLISEGVGVVKEIADLAQRVKNGEVIPIEEIQAAREEIDDAIKNWSK